MKRSPIRLLISDGAPELVDSLLSWLRTHGRDVSVERVQCSEGLKAALVDARWDVLLAVSSSVDQHVRSAIELAGGLDPDLSVVVLAEEYGEAAAVEAMRAGAADYLSRQRLNMFGAVVERIVREKESRPAHISQLLMSEGEIVAQIGSWRWEPAKDLWQLSEGCRRILGCCSGGLRSGDLLDAVQLEDRSRVASAFRDVVRNESRVELEYRVVRRSFGDVRWVHAFGERRGNRRGGTLVFGVIQDITDRKNAEDALRKREEHFRRLVENGHEVIALYDASGIILYESPAVVRVLGFDPSELVGTSSFDLIHPDDSQVAGECMSRIFESPGTAVRLEIRARHKDGGYRWLDFVATNQLHEPAIQAIVGNYRDATDRKRAEDALRQERDRLAKIAETAPGVLHSARGGDEGIEEFIYLSPGIKDLFGVAAETLLADPGRLQEVIHPDDRAPLQAAASDSSRTMTPLQFEFRVHHPSRGEIWIKVHSSPIRDVDGSTVWHGFLQDITRPKQQEQILRDSEERFRTTFEQAAVGMTHVGLDGRFLRVNGRFAEITGYSREELLTRTVQEITHPGDRENDRMRVGPLLSGEADSSSWEKRYLRKDGGVAWVAVTVASRRSETGKPIDFIGVVEDITARKRTEDEARRARQMLQLVLDTVPLSVFWKSRDLRYLGCNRIHAAMMGLAESDEILGRTDLELLASGREQAEYSGASDREVLDTGLPRFAIEEQRTLSDGRVIRLETTKLPLRDANGHVIGVIGTSQDVTDRRQLEEQLRQAQKMEAIGRLAGGIAHDFNNVLTVVNGYAEMLLAEIGSDDRRWSPLSAIHDAGRRAARLTNQLLAFSRRAMVERRALDLNTVVEDSARLLGRVIGERIAIELSLKRGIPRIMADPGQIEQMIMNLVLNARDAMPAGGRLMLGTDVVSIGQDDNVSHPRLAAGEYVQLTVADTGQGMSAEVRVRIFEPFFTTKEMGQGTGLGLAVVHGIVEQGGGHIRVASDIGRGTTFTILFPATDEPIAPILPLFERDAIGVETILIVEDEAAVRTLTRIALEAKGYNVLSASNGLEAIALAEQSETIHLLITDLVMPGLSGRQVAEAIRKKYDKTAVLYISGYTEDILLRDNVESLGSGVLQKPFTLSALTRRVHELLELTRSDTCRSSASCHIR
jgi:two-component system cell cycle sensor histidine kinase/response regulator CckA